MARYGHITYRSGRQVLTPDGFGGVFVELITIGTGSVSRTFTDLDTMNIFGQVVFGGWHTITFGRDANGYPYVYSPGYTPPAGAPAGNYETKLAVFAR